MKAIMISYDSLNRNYLGPYGNTWVKTPHFDRLAQKAMVFDKNYVGSLPCMPARRELHTGRYNFLHRSWGPLEPFDDSMPEILKKSGVYAHLVSDHGHYWEDGGCTYHTRYSTWDFCRGQEGDPWKPVVGEVAIPEHLGQLWRQDAVNRRFINTEESQPQTKTFAGGIEFLDMNHEADNWFLHIETFDPHEPFYTMPEYQRLYEQHYEGPLFDWPPYSPVTEEERPYVAHMRNMYAALVTMCDRNLGRILDRMDAYDLWQDTLLIVNTDHGFLVGEHDWWAKTSLGHIYEEVVHTPLLIYDPVSKKTGRNSCLTQSIDLAPTVLDFFGIAPTTDMQGKSLFGTLRENKIVHQSIIMGTHGTQIMCTDGRYKYIAAPKETNEPLYNYTLMPTHMRTPYPVEEFQGVELHEGFSFTKGCKVLKTKDFNYFELKPAQTRHPFSTQLYDMALDPDQASPMTSPEIEAYMKSEIIRHMRENDAPEEQYLRMGFTAENEAP